MTQILKSSKCQIFDPDDSRKIFIETEADEDGVYSVANIYTFAEDDLRGEWRIEANWLNYGGQFARTTFTLSN